VDNITVMEMEELKTAGLKPEMIAFYQDLLRVQ
jgi:hypothetical protein